MNTLGQNQMLRVCFANSEMKARGAERRSWRTVSRLAFAIIGVCSMVTACTKNKLNLPLETSAGAIYSTGSKLLAAGKYSKAAEYFGLISRRHPYSKESRQSVLLTAVAHFRAGKFDEAELEARRFIRLYPASDQVPYALFLVAESFIKRVEDRERDQDAARSANQAYTELIQRFPNSEYVGRSRKSREIARDHLAAYELNVGRYYQRQEHYLAAVNRYNVVVSEFPGSSYEPEALYRLVESYVSLGVRGEAISSARRLSMRAPGSTWHREASRLLGVPLSAAAPPSSNMNSKGSSGSTPPRTGDPEAEPANAAVDVVSQLWKMHAAPTLHS